VKVGRHSEGRHPRLIKRADKSFMDAGRELDLAHRLRSQAEHLAPVRIAGDAAREREAERAARAAEIGPGDLVEDPIFGEGVVKRANRHTFTIAFVARGFVSACDKGRVQLVDKRPLTPLPAPQFKPGDLVTARPPRRALSGHCAAAHRARLYCRNRVLRPPPQRDLFRVRP
jgi:hypothetical protein